MDRRDFIKSAAVGAAILAASAGGAVAEDSTPWYRRAIRWGQTNITERDPVRYDIPWWREYWKRTFVQGIIINAGGIVAYYPSKFPLQHRAEFLGDRDLYGELASAAHEDGLAVLARMDCSRVGEDFFKAQPDWFARQATGAPYQVADKYITCINSPYYDEYIPGILREIIERSHPEGFGDNSWSGLTRNDICYCENCGKKFREQTNQLLPQHKDWNDRVYRQWIEWNYGRRLEVWDNFNRVTKAAGGQHCLWLGMNSGSITAESNAFRNFREIAKRSEFLLLDHQSRNDATGFQENGDTGKLVHEMLGWDKNIIESMALYQARVAARPEPEARMWMVEGIAGGIGPWWHMVGAYHDDRRMYHTPEQVFQWHKKHERYLVDRTPYAKVGVVWSQRNTDYFGRDSAADRVDAPYRGFTQALIRGRIPYVPICAADIGQQHDLAVLILPNIGALSEAESQAIHDFAHGGGNVVATGATSLYDEWGDPRPDFALADLFGAHAPSSDFGLMQPSQDNSYLRLLPERRGNVWGPKLPDDPTTTQGRHPVLRGFDETDILTFGGVLQNMRTDPGVTVPMTFVPAFPAFPPETAWMRQPKTDIPALVLNQAGSARVAYLPADIDRRYARNILPDHGTLLANIVKWAAGDQINFYLDGAGLVDCHLYRQSGALIVHIVNLTNEGAWRGPIDELIPVGPFKMRIKLPSDLRVRTAELLVSATKPNISIQQGWATLEIKHLVDHEVVVLA